MSQDIDERNQIIENLGDQEITSSEYQKHQDYDLNKILKKSPKLVGKVMSQIDKIDDVRINSDGTVTHNWLRYVQRSSVSKKENEANKKKLKKAGVKIDVHGNHLGR